MGARPPARHEVERATARSRDEFRAALERALAEVDADERLGPLLGATRLRMRFEFTDLDLALNVAAGEERPQHRLVVRRRPGLAAEARACG